MIHRTFCLVLSAFLLLSLNANAEMMGFRYTFTGTPDQQPWAAGATIEVMFDGTLQADNDTIVINSIDSIALTRAGGVPLYNFGTVDPGEIETIPAGGTPTVSITGSNLNFTICPNGFTVDTDGVDGVDNCDYTTDGGFGMTYGATASAGDWASAADDTGTTNCASSGCPVTDSPIDISQWMLDADADGDGVLDSSDNCPDTGNPFQLDIDGNGVGDICEVLSVQNFSDGSRPALSGTLNTNDLSSCVANGWLIYNCNNIVEGENGAGDNALLVDSEGGNFNFMTWERFPNADRRFLGDLLTDEVTAIRFRARHAGGADDLVLRAMILDSANDGGADFTISDGAATIVAGSGWATYEITLTSDVMSEGTRLFGNSAPTAARRTYSEIMSAAAQFSLRHDPGFTGPGTSAPTDGTMEIDDIELVGTGSFGLASLFALGLIAIRRYRRYAA